jgi:hypothetical protein
MILTHSQVVIQLQTWKGGLGSRGSKPFKTPLGTPRDAQGRPWTPPKTMENGGMGGGGVGTPTMGGRKGLIAPPNKNYLSLKVLQTPELCAFEVPPFFKFSIFINSHIFDKLYSNFKQAPDTQFSL